MPFLYYWMTFQLFDFLCSIVGKESIVGITDTFYFVEKIYK